MGDAPKERGSWLIDLIMELCAGDITKREWITWNVTLKDAIEWCKYNIKRRYEWLEIIGQAFGITAEEEGKKKKCRDASICSMCRKPCSQRLQ